MSIINQVIDRMTGTEPDISNTISRTIVVVTTFWVASDFEGVADRYN